MNRQALIAGALAAVVGGLVGASCSTAQPPAECNFQGAPYTYWMVYNVTDAGTGGSCSTYEGDLIAFQRYSPPGAKMTFGMLPRRVGAATRADSCVGGSLDGKFFRTDETAGGGREAAIGTFTSSYPDTNGYCSTSGIAPTEQTFPLVTEAMCLDAGINKENGDGGWNKSGMTFEDYIAAKGGTPLHLKYDWSDFRLLSTARYVQTVWEADVTVTSNTCSASYHVQGLFPPVGCTSDVDCSPVADLDAGKPTGSGISPDFHPRCYHFKNPSGYEATRFGLAAPAWEAGADYAAGDTVYTTGADGVKRIYQADADGTSGTTSPDGTGSGISDGAMTWSYVSLTGGVCRPSDPTKTELSPLTIDDIQKQP